MSTQVDREQSRFRVLEDGDNEVSPDSAVGAGRPLLLLAVVVFAAMAAWIVFSLINSALG